ncbi:MAG: CAP domain-containing protein [Planctomycetota bacterium]|jgi:hypothetical protein
MRRASCLARPVAFAFAFVAGTTAAARAGAADAPQLDREREKELRSRLSEFARAEDDSERIRIAEAALALGAPAAGRVGQAVRRRLDVLLRDYYRDFGAAARRVQAERVLATARAEARSLVRVRLWKEILVEKSDDVVKKRVGSEGAPALKALKGLLIVSADDPALREGALGASRAAIIKLGGLLDRCRAASGEADAPKVIAGTEVPKPDRRGTLEDHFRRRERAIVLAATVARAEDARVILSNEDLAMDLDVEEAEGVLELNTLRVLMGLSSVAVNPGLSAAARDHSNDMHERGFFSHTSPVAGKQGFGQRAKRYGAGAGGECIAAGAGQGSRAIHMWLHSPGHMRIILSKGTYSVGLGRRAKKWTLLAGGGAKRPHPLLAKAPFIPGVDPDDPTSRARTVYELLKRGRYADVVRVTERLREAKALADRDRTALRIMELDVLNRADAAVERIRAIEKGGDVYALAIAVREARAGFGTVREVTEALAPVEEKLKTAPVRKELRVGAQYHRMAAMVRAMKDAQRKRSRLVIAKQLESFAKRNKESVYAAAAREAARRFKSGDESRDPFEAHFAAAGAE